MLSCERRQRLESDGFAPSAPPTAAAQHSLAASSKAKHTGVSSDWVAIVLKLLDQVGKFENPKTSISIAVNHLVSFPLTKAK